MNHDSGQSCMALLYGMWCGCHGYDIAGQNQFTDTTCTIVELVDITAFIKNEN